MNPIVESRRRAELITPIPGPKKRRRGQKALVYDEGQDLSTEAQQYEATSTAPRRSVRRRDRAQHRRKRSVCYSSHMPVTIPSFLLRDIFGNEHARALLLHLTEQAEPMPYSESRRSLGLHPQQFQRALDQLESHGLVGLSAPDDVDKDHAQRRYRVFLEPTALGSFCADLWERMNADYSQLAAEREISEEALVASAGGD